MQSKRDGWVSIREASTGLDGPIQVRRHFTQPIRYRMISGMTKESKDRGGTPSPTEGHALTNEHRRVEEYE